MSSTIITNITLLAGIRDTESALRQTDLATLPSIDNAWLLIEGDEIAGFGKMSDLNKNNIPSNNIDATGKIVLPAWCDSHTHLVFAGSREGEFVDKIRGLSYADIAAK